MGALTTLTRRKLFIVSLIASVLLTVYYVYIHHNVGLQSLKEVYIDHSSNKRIKTVESVSHEDLPKDNGNSNERKDNTIDNTFEIKDSVPILGSINYDEWACEPFDGYLVDDLRTHQHQWPKHPTSRRSGKAIHVYYERYLEIGAKLYGLILPPVSGTYEFRIRQVKSTAAINGEFWISNDSNPLNIQKLTTLTYSRVPKVVVKGSSDTSKPQSIKLDKDQKYYFEFHIKGFKGRTNMSVEWKLTHQEIFQPISPSSLAMAVKLNGSSYSNSVEYSSIIKILQSDNLPSNKIQSGSHTVYTVSKITDLNILPQCEFTPLYVSKHSHLSYNTFESTIYTVDTRFRSLLKLTPQSTVNHVLQLYTDQFNNARSKNDSLVRVVDIYHLEETNNRGSGSRFLLEMTVELKQGIVRTSEYVYLPKNSKTLCHTSNFQWKRDADVHLLVTIKNLGRWVNHLIYNLQDIHEKTGDKRFELVVVDYDSTDIDIKKELEKSSLPRWRYIQLKGTKFHKTRALQAGIDDIKDVNSIVMVIDMHMKLPLNFVDTVRKHMVQGKMAFAPVVIKLPPGYSEINVKGPYTHTGYGIFGMFKSDWVAMGGYNTEKFKYSWGGEDWNAVGKTLSKGYEVFRMRAPGVVHYFHTKDGMWDSKNKPPYDC